MPRQYSRHDINVQNFEYAKESNAFDASHSLDEQPPPPGDETELHNLQALPATNEHEVHEKDLKVNADDTPKDSSDMNGSNKVESDARRADHDQKKGEHHHHHKKSRGKNYETSSDDKKVRDKKKRKKSREHEKKKNKKDRRDRDKDKKTSSKTGSVEKTPEAAAEEMASVDSKEIDNLVEVEVHRHRSSKEEVEVFKKQDNAGVEEEPITMPSLKKQTEAQPFKRSDSILDINLNADIDLDEWIAPEKSKWEREENKSTTSLETSELEVGNGDVKKNPEEKITSEILKRAENAIFARAISAIRPMENKKVKPLQDHEAAAGKEASPVTSSMKRPDSVKDSKTQAFQVTIPANETGNRSVELKTLDGARESSRLKKSPMRTSIKNRLGIKIIEKKSRSKSPSRSPKRRLQSDCTKVVRTSRDSGARPGEQRLGGERYPSSENRRNKQLSSLIKVTQETRDSGRHNSNSNSNSRGRPSEKRRSPASGDRKGSMRRARPVSRSKSPARQNLRRHDQKANPDKSMGKPKEPNRSDEKSSKVADPPLSDYDKAKAKNTRQEPETSVKKRSREPSSSSTSSSASSSGSHKHSKRHSKHKVKKKSRSLSVESNGNAKRKKSKKEKKSKKKKKSRK